MKTGQLPRDRQPPGQSARCITSTVTLVCMACTAPSGDDRLLLSNQESLVLEEERRLGSAEDLVGGFYRVADVTEDEEGFVYVLDSGDCRVRVYDKAGRFVRGMGRRGSGPGEFRVPVSLGVTGDTLWVSDVSLARLTLFSREGLLVSTISPPVVRISVLPGVEVRLLPGRLRRDGLIASASSISIPRTVPTDSFSIPRVLMDRKGNVVDTVLLERWAIPPRREARVGGYSIPVPPPPSFGPIYLATERGNFIVERPFPGDDDLGSFRVSRVRSGHDTLYSREFVYQPEGFPRAFVDALIREAAAPHQRMRGLDSTRVALSLVQAVNLPSFQPPVSLAFPGEHGEILLRGPDDGSSTYRWYALDPEGKWLGMMRLPRRATVHWVLKDVLWVEVPDDFDVPWLVRYRIRRKMSMMRSANPSWPRERVEEGHP